MKTEITKISAINGYIRLMTINIENKTYTIRISQEMYEHLKKCNVPTCQKLRYQK